MTEQNRHDVIADIVERAVIRLTHARMAAHRLPDQQAKWARLAELHEREARWWDVLLRNTSYYAIPPVYRAAVIDAYTLAVTTADRAHELAYEARLTMKEVA